MKKFTNIFLSLILVLLFYACEKSKLLDKIPQDSYSDATVWSDPAVANSYLNYCYHDLQHGFRYNMMGCFSDEMPVSRGDETLPYNSGTITPDNFSSGGANPLSHIMWTKSVWENVQRINMFLKNIDQIKDNYPASEQAAVKAKTDVMKGEALFLRAYVYHNLCRLYGGVPIMTVANKIGDDFGSITRATFEETVNFIVEDCDAAAALLPLKASQVMGRATREAAMALKSRILLFAASDLTADGTAASELTGYPAGTNRTALWTNAKNAAWDVMQLGTAKLADFGAPDQAAVAMNYFELFKSYTLANDEIIWGRMFSPNLGLTQRINQINGLNGNNCYGRNGVLQQMVDEYEMSDGSKLFDHFEIDANKLYKNISTKFGHENPYYNREPRFYASVLYDSAVWQPRTAALSARDPLGIYERRTHRTMHAGGTYTDVFGIDTKGGPVSPGNGCYSGYLTKKFMDNTSNGDVQNNQNVWIYMRYAEVLFNYAEACLELGEIAEAAKYINMIRNRSGLPDFTGDIEQALRHERKVELFGEEVRWFDIRRWKILIEVLSPPLGGIDILEVKNTNGTIVTTWKWINPIPDNIPSEKLYWLPIGRNEVKKSPQLIQNPGY